MWDIFGKYHYLNHTINQSAQQFLLFFDGQLAGFCGVINFPHPKVKNMRRITRLVILPQFQGFGLGRYLATWVGNYYKNQNLRLRIATTHPSLVHHLTNHPEWEFVYKKFHKEVYDNTTIKGRMSAGFRTTWTFEIKSDLYNPKK